MKHVLEQKCPACGAMMVFDPNVQKLVCEYCGTQVVFDPEKLQEAAGVVEGFRFSDFSKGYEDPAAAPLPIYNCMSCGAELIAPPEQFAMTCPYCRNNIVLTDKVTGNLRPNGVIPFRITADQLPELLKNNYKKQKLLPASFFSKAAMSGVSGVYVPFWLFSGKLNGEAGFIGTTTEKTYTSTHAITSTSYYEFTVDLSMAFNDVPVDASSRIEDALMDSLEPFDMKEAMPFATGFLAGFTADRFDTPSDKIEGRAQKRLANTADSLISSKTKYAGARRISGSLQMDMDAKYYLLPVYLFKLKYAGKEYPFAVNGQTGKVVGKLPDTKALARKYFWKRFGIVAIAIIAIFLLVFLIGG